jgi:multiple RNA-binding domain-containing protein 1
MIFNSDGTSRRFAFVGFRTEKDASRAKRYFNDTYIDTSKIIVEKSKPVSVYKYDFQAFYTLLFG